MAPNVNKQNYFLTNESDERMYDRMVEAGGAVPPRELLWVFLRLHSRGVWEHRQNLLPVPVLTRNLVQDAQMVRSVARVLHWQQGLRFPLPTFMTAAHQVLMPRGQVTGNEGFTGLATDHFNATGITDTAIAVGPAADQRGRRTLAERRGLRVTPLLIVTAGMQVQHEEAGLNSVDALNGSGYLSSNLTTPELSSVFSGSGSTRAANPPDSSTSLATEPRLPLLSGGRQAGIFQFPDSDSSSVESTRERFSGADSRCSIL
ncbi:uncharacterized protein LOC142339318 [Convolutriloba macropyga]|uniref:uncharacterized protein LOC142339318 n=1 Tax=Convolutriloba macropyga TaxID=536237 RepID=UPI003F520547